MIERCYDFSQSEGPESMAKYKNDCIHSNDARLKKMREDNSLDNYLKLAVNSKNPEYKKLLDEKKIFIQESKGFSDTQKLITDQEFDDSVQKDNQRVEISSKVGGMTFSDSVNVHDNVELTPGESLSCSKEKVNKNKISPKNKEIIEKIIKKYSKIGDQMDKFHFTEKKSLLSEDKIISKKIYRQA